MTHGQRVLAPDPAIERPLRTVPLRELPAGDTFRVDGLPEHLWSRPAWRADHPWPTVELYVDGETYVP